MNTENNYVEKFGLNPWMHMRVLDIDRDIETIYAWFQMEYAAFWNMQSMSIDDTKQIYAGIHKTKSNGSVSRIL
jgi:hypothetical protein